MFQMVQGFWDAYRTVASPNGFSLLKIDADITLTPLEMASIASTMKQNHEPEDVLLWLRRRHGQSGETLLRNPKQFRRHRINEQFEILFGGKSSRKKNFLIAFMGTGSMFMMPKPVFLQQFDPEEWIIFCVYTNPPKLRNDYDLKNVVRVPGKPFFSTGQFAKSADEIAKRVLRTVDLKSCKTVVCAGVSEVVRQNWTAC